MKQWAQSDAFGPSPKAIELWEALGLARVSGRSDVWRHKGMVFLPTGWFTAHPKMILAIGETYQFQDSAGNKTIFVAGSK